MGNLHTTASLKGENPREREIEKKWVREKTCMKGVGIGGEKSFVLLYIVSGGGLPAQKKESRNNNKRKKGKKKKGKTG